MLWCVRNFLRHYAIKEKKKTHLLAWDEFSEKKTWGGLGFQDFSCCPNKGGCFCVGDAISKRGDSGGWGSSGGLGMELQLDLDEIEKVQQLIDESSASLKEDLVRQTLSTEDAKLVLSMPLPYFSGRLHLFDITPRMVCIQSSYEVALMLERNGLIKKKGEEETYFIWKMCLDIAPTNEVLYKKKVVHDAVCCVCKEEEESAAHILARCQNCVAPKPANLCKAIASLVIWKLWKNRKCGFSSFKNLPYKGG
ncbi:unnamed protein product [Camellia sinensis]